MVEKTIERVLYLWLLPEIVLLFGLFALLAASLLSVRTAAYSRPLQIAALAFVTVELLIPAWVFLDLRRREDKPDRMWIHATAMPLVNVFGLLGCLEDQRRSRE